MKDLQVLEAIKAEERRQENTIELIASENIVSADVQAAQGSVLTNKYAEGYPYKRYYGGTEHVDVVEDIARDRVKQLFGAKYANVQPHSGSQANAAAYAVLINPGDKVLGMDLTAGGHLTHGHKMNFSGKTYEFHAYGVNDDGLIDYDSVEALAKTVKPQLIVAGASAYSRQIDFKRFKEIADQVSAKLMVDMAHIAGLVAAGLHQNPVHYADVVTSTTHKTLRGPRGGLILTNDEELAKKIDSAVFPGLQGGPLMHVIAAKAIAFGEALTDDFVTYQEQVIKNAKTMAEVFLKKPNAKVISGGTDNHLFLLDVTGYGLNGKEAQELLDTIGITVNKNTIPNETLSPFKTSGIRIGTPAITTRGFKEDDCRLVAEYIHELLLNHDKPEILETYKTFVSALIATKPIGFATIA